jgi:predicted DCC family thiol-disulfide oxidoreductase YuxK
MTHLRPLTLFYDGRCPLCLAEIHVLRARNHRGLLQFVDVSADGYDEAAHAVSCEQALAQMHGRLATGELLTGVAVFAESYRRVGLDPLARLLSIQWLAPVWALGYRLFARHRHAISAVLGPPLLRLSKRRYPD